MQKLADFLSEFGWARADRFLDAGEEQRFPPGTVIIREGRVCDGIYFVLQGLLEVRTQAVPRQAVAVLGPGEIIGEMSFVDGRSASATVSTKEPSTLLYFAAAPLREALERDPETGSAFYRALAAATSRRLRRTLAQLGLAEEAREALGGQSAAWRTVEEGLGAFKDAVSAASRIAVAGGEVGPEAQARVGAAFGQLVEQLDQVLGEGSAFGDSVRQQLGSVVRRELLPYVLVTDCAHRMYAKPRGFPADHRCLELVYRNLPGGTGAVGRLLDACFLDLPLVRSLRNRRALMARELRGTLDQTAAGRAACVTSFGCGPAAEVFDVLEGLADRRRLRCWLVDIDFEALASVAERQSRGGLGENLELLRENLILVAAGRRRLELPPQDLVYSLGLLDFFDDSLSVRLLDVMHGLLRPGGRLLVGNVLRGSPSLAVTEHLLEWPIVARTEGDMQRLLRASKFGSPAGRVLVEDEGVTVFAECVRRG